MRRFAIAACLLLSLGCEAGDELASDAKLIGGEITNDPLLASFVSIGGCSAVLATPRVIMTAAHCIHNFSTTGDIRSSYRAGRTITFRNNANSVQAKIASSHVHPSWEKACTASRPCDPKRAGAGNDPSVSDLAVIVLTENVTAIPSANVDLSAVQAGDEVVVAGYGCETGINRGNSGNRKAMATKAVDGTTALAHSGSERGDAIAETLSANFVTPGKEDGGPSLCPGDSGGPVYRRGTNKLVGINADYTFIGEYEQTGAIAKTNIHAKFNATSVTPWLKDLLRIVDNEMVKDLYLSVRDDATGASVLYAASGLTAQSIELCAGQEQECAAPIKLELVKESGDRRFFKSSYQLSAGPLTVVTRDQNGAVVTRQVFSVTGN